MRQPYEVFKHHTVLVTSDNSAGSTPQLDQASEYVNQAGSTHRHQKR